MGGLFHLGALLLLSAWLGACSHIDADPHFWPGARHRLRKVPPTPISKDQLPKPVLFAEPPSATKSSWKLISKESFAQRTYELVVRNDKDELMDGPVAPELIIDGETVLHRVIKVAPATWRVTLEFTVDQSNTRIGFKYGGHRVDKFRQIPFQTYEVDYIATRSFTNKSRVRADGKDSWRVYIDLKDRWGYNISSINDFNFQLHIENGNAEIIGPLSGSNGPYFSVRRTKPGELSYYVTVDEQRVSGAGRVVFFQSDVRRPAAERRDCLEDLSQMAKIKVPIQMEADEAYTRLAQEIVRRFEEKADLTPETLQKTLDAFSSEACSANRVWDQARDQAGNMLRNAHRRLSR